MSGMQHNQRDPQEINLKILTREEFNKIIISKLIFLIANS